MIVFRTEAWDWDVTNYGLTFTEESPYFEDVITKSYSFPTTVELTEDNAYKLGLIHLEGRTKYKNKIYGYLVIDNTFYDAYIAINKVEGTTAEITFYYGDATLAVFDMNLKTLPFKVNAAPGNDLRTYAKTLLSSTWPTATHQFISVYRDDISNDSNYDYFEGWVNQMKYSDSLNTWYFVENTNDDIDGVTTAVNRNVMAPMTYLLEILKVGFNVEGKELRGELVNDDFFKKVLLVPKNFMEEFAVTQYLNYSFSSYTYQEQNDGNTLNVYEQIHQPQIEGVYNLDIKINMNSSIAQYFYFSVVQDGNVIYEANTEGQQVVINESLTINVVPASTLPEIVVTLKLVQQTTDISQYNNFTYSYKEGQLNVFPSVYTIADYLPDLTFREFFNKIKNWLNLDAIYTENAVYLNFLENAIENFRYIDRTDLEQKDAPRTLNENNLFKLNYPNGNEVMVNANGQTFDDTDFVDEETEEMAFEVLPLEIEDNFNKITATYPEDEEDIMLILFNGNGNEENLATNQIDNRTLSVQDVYNWFWSKWLTFRANSETVKDSFYLHHTQAINLREGEYKYNTKRLIVSLTKTRVSTEYYEVELTAETF